MRRPEENYFETSGANPHSPAPINEKFYNDNKIVFYCLRNTLKYNVFVKHLNQLHRLRTVVKLDLGVKY